VVAQFPSAFPNSLYETQNTESTVRDSCIHNVLRKLLQTCAFKTVALVLPGGNVMCAHVLAARAANTLSALKCHGAVETSAKASEGTIAAQRKRQLQHNHHCPILVGSNEKQIRTEHDRQNQGVCQGV
jgi:hypothetical protein